MLPECADEAREDVGAVPHRRGDHERRRPCPPRLVWGRPEVVDVEHLGKDEVADFTRVGDDAVARPSVSIIVLPLLPPVDAQRLTRVLREVVQAGQSETVHVVDEVLRPHPPLVELLPPVRRHETVDAHVNVVLDRALGPVEEVPPNSGVGREPYRPDEAVQERLVVVRRHA